MALALAASPAAAAEGQWSFGYSGEPQSFTVPPEVTKLSMVVVGGAGGQTSSSIGGAGGGVSGMAYGRFDVTPGEVLTIWVGGPGLSANGAAGVSWGFGCGASGGSGEGIAAEDGGGGGAASAVTRGAVSIAPGDCTTRPEEGEEEEGNPVLVVGGGGGGGGANDFVPPSPGGSSLSLGGVGGDGGLPAGFFGGPGGYIAAGGCGGCEKSFSGQAGTPNPGNGGGAGGGGGGYGGGGGGETAIENGGGGGGGGNSFVHPGAEESGYVAGYGSGAGSVLLTELGSEVFQCTGSSQGASVPAGAGLLSVEASGGHGGSAGETLGGAGGAGGAATALVRVSPGEHVKADTGCAGSGSSGGWGYGVGGTGGSTPSPHALDGSGGGGSSGVVVGGRRVLIAAGGGGGGGNGGVATGNKRGEGGAGGGGGEGGERAANGGHGEPDDYAGGWGGEGGAYEGLNGESGGNAGRDSVAGGGGGGGAGWQSGTGGHEGRHDIGFDGGGGGGGGAGTTGVHVGALKFTYGTSQLAGNGLVELTYLPPVPASIGAYGGSKQQATIGAEFAQPLAALVTDSGSNPVPNVQVEFALPGAGASGSFAGGGTTETVTTGANGVAVSSPLSANLNAGAWEATASVAPVTTPASFALVNSPSPTATGLVASEDPATPTEPVTFTATVTAAAPAAGTPVGSVQFEVDGADLGAPVPLDGGGSATSIPVTGLSAGTHAIEASFEGSAGYLASGGSLELTVRKTTTATELTSSANPALPTESIAFTAAIEVPPGNTPYSGTVQFSVDGTPLGAPQAASNGTATSPPFETTVVQSHQVAAVAAETADYLGSTGRLVEVVDPDGTSVDVGSSANPAEYGSPLQLEAEVVPRPPVTLVPTGSVGFTAGAQVCNGTLAAAKTACALGAPLSPGSHDVLAQYSGDADYDPSAGAMVQQIAKAHTETALAGDPAGPVVFGEEVSFGAEVGRRNAGTGTPSGTVQFALDGTALGGPVTLDSGAGESQPLIPAAGAHVATAAYGGDADFEASKGVAPYVVLPAPTTVELSASPEPSQPGEPVVFGAVVEAAEPADGGAAPVPTGRVLFRVDGADFGPAVPLAAGDASSAPYERFKPGRHDVTAIYVPADLNFEPSYASLEHSVEQPTIVSVASSANPAAAGASVTVAAHVGPLAPAGTIDFQVDGNPAPGCQAVPVQESDARCTLAGLAPGAHQVRAAYSGAPLFDPSQGSLVQNVNTAPVSSPPPACKLIAVRGRMLVHRSRDAIRLVARYRTAAKAQVKIEFFSRRGEDETARRLGTLKRTFSKERLARLDLRLPAKEMKRLRRSASGFIARFTVAGDPGYCSESFGKDLSIRRQVANQLIWFQSDSARADLPPDSR